MCWLQKKSLSALGNFRIFAIFRVFPGPWLPWLFTEFYQTPTVAICGLRFVSPKMCTLTLYIPRNNGEYINIYIYIFIIIITTIIII